MQIKEENNKEQPDILPKLQKLPTSPVIDLIVRLLGTNGETEQLKQLEEKDKALGTKHNYTIKESPDTQTPKARYIQQIGRDTTTTITINDIEELAGNNKGVKKLFIYTLMAINEQVNEQALSRNNDLSQYIVTFSLEDIVKAGLYSDIRAARRGVEAYRAVLQNFKLHATVVVNKGKKTEKTYKTDDIKKEMEKEKGENIQADFLLSMFVGDGFVENAIDIKNNVCIILLNPFFNWQPVARFYTIFPEYAFGLKLNAFDLFYYIFYRARMNDKEIREQYMLQKKAAENKKNKEQIELEGGLNISFKSIHARLGLPAIEGNRRPAQTIREPIEKAVTEIEDTYKKYCEKYNLPTNFTITPVYSENWNIKEYIEHGYLKISFKGDYVDYFVDVAGKQEKQIEEANKKKEAREEKARTQALTNVITEELKNTAAIQDIRATISYTKHQHGHK